MLDLDYGSQPQQPPQFRAASVDDLSYIDDDRGQYSDLLTLAALRRWDFPVFELSDRCPDTLLSRVRPDRMPAHTHTHTHTHPFNGPFPGLPW